MNTSFAQTSGNKSQTYSNSITQKKQNVNQTTFKFTDNRQESMIQKKIQQMANENPHSVPFVQLKSNIHDLNKPFTSINTNVIQRNKHKKRLLNVLSLGIRKAYTYNKKKKMTNAVQNVPQPHEEVQSQMDQFVNAYEKSRYYHQTGTKNFPSIEQHGLLNFTDREQKLDENVIGMSRLGGEYKDDEKKGVFLGPKHLMKENGMTTNVVRAFMPADRTKLHHWTEEKETPPNEMFRDEKFRGGAVITKNSIPSEQVTTGKMSDLIDTEGPKLNSILEAVGSQYEGEAPDKETMKGLLKEAIRERRLSNVAFDNS